MFQTIFKCKLHNSTKCSVQFRDTTVMSVDASFCKSALSLMQLALHLCQILSMSKGYSEHPWQGKWQEGRKIASVFNRFGHWHP